MRTVVMLGGASAGHLFPALSVSEKLLSMDKDVNIVFLGSDKAVYNRNKFDEYISTGRFDFRRFEFGRVDSSNKFKYIGAMFKYMGKVFDVYKMMKEISPAVTVGFGGYQSFLPVVCSRMLGRKTLIHEQNVKFGLANKLLSPFADKVALSFPSEGSSSRKVTTGNPVRKFDKDALQGDKASQRRKLGLLPDVFTISVVGGSSGSGFLNDIVLDVFKAASEDEELKNRLQVIHISGKAHYGTVSAKAKDIGLNYMVKDFCDDMESVFLSSDLVISRAGATTIAELSYFSLPAVFIPYPHAFSHQIKNARFIMEREACIMFEEQGADKDSLLSSVKKIYSDESLRKRLAENIHKLYADSADENLARLILQLSN